MLDARQGLRVISSTIDAPLRKTTREWSTLWTTCLPDTLPQDGWLSPEALRDNKETITLQVMIGSAVSLLGSLNQVTTDFEIHFLELLGRCSARQNLQDTVEFRQWFALRRNSIDHHRAVHVSLNTVLKSHVLARSANMTTPASWHARPGLLKETCSELHCPVSIEEVDEGKTVTGTMLEVYRHEK